MNLFNIFTSNLPSTDDLNTMYFFAASLICFSNISFSTPVADANKSSIKSRSSMMSPPAFLVLPAPNICVIMLYGFVSPNLASSKLFFLSSLSKGWIIFLIKSCFVVIILLNCSSGKIALSVPSFCSMNFL